MGKPSIFSREYERKMKRRRNTIIFSIIIILLVSVGVVFNTKAIKFLSYAKNSITSIFAKDKNKEADKNSTNEDTTKKESTTAETNQPTNTKKEEAVQEKSMDIKLSNGEVLKAIYEGDGSSRVYKFVSGSSNAGNAEISPSSKLILVMDNLTQDIKTYNTDGQEAVITKAEYVTSKGESFPKDKMLSTYSGYVWCKDARFIDDSHIAYLSQLPYFGTGELDTYVWIIDLGTGEHRAVWNLKGKNVSLGNLKDGGIQVAIDNNTSLLMPDGSVTPQ
ncbi:hypothetical protein [Clostridium sp. 'White wine YQ']|uniref:hypothetical protein n=1 Tax=Clostridium sp. 'White wine YQ' TaxID=3027474 RepID=UPI002365915B|nr:hypothetical protein [Clostridium sp. 'White wine YQ']MDD7792978.1 hypothetical protein [Clostridium sp. 'White wine YQ']